MTTGGPAALAPGWGAALWSLEIRCRNCTKDPVQISRDVKNFFPVVVAFASLLLFGDADEQNMAEASALCSRGRSLCHNLGASRRSKAAHPNRGTGGIPFFALASLLLSACCNADGAPLLHRPLAFLNHRCRPIHRVRTKSTMPAPEEISILDSPVPPPPGSRLKPSVSAVTLSTVATALTGTESGEESTTLLAPGVARLKETIARVPCRGYVSGKTPTPVEYMPRLSELCGGPALYVKRDDMLPLAGGGSKTRKLGEYGRLVAIRFVVQYCNSICNMQ